MHTSPAATVSSATAKRAKKYKIIIVGAGAAGIGNAIALKYLGLDEKDFIILERETIGASFKKWPKEMRFITPSFTGNQFGAVDLNAISTDTSPAFTLNKEHVSGEEYAIYLNAIAEHYQLPLEVEIDVSTVQKHKEHFALETSKGTYHTDFLIWCGGEFQFPNLSPFKGAEHCIHNTHLTSYKELTGDKQVVIGGYESGADAAVNLSKIGKKVSVLDSGNPWNETSSDPSRVLSTYTYERLSDEMSQENIELLGDFEVKEIIKTDKGYTLTSKQGKKMECQDKPILCTGFSGSTKLVENLFKENKNGDIALTENDESTITENLFLSGPMVRQDQAIFCFIYKFRQRFPIIAQTIAKRLNISTEGLEIYKKANMYLDDLSCCEDECIC